MSHAVDIDILLNIALVILFYCVGMVFIFFLKNHDRVTIVKIFSLAFVLRVAAVFMIYSYLVGIGGDGFALTDDRKYSYTATAMSEKIDRGKQGYLKYESGLANIGYFNFNAFLYNKLGFDTISSRLINALSISLTAVLFYLIFETLFDRRRAKILGYMIALLPNLIFWGALQFKDALIIFCAAVLLYILICKFRGRLRISTVITFTVFATALWLLRRDYCLPYLAVVSLLLLFRYTKLESIINSSRRSSALKFMILGVFGMGVIGVTLLTPAGERLAGMAVYYSEGQSSIASRISGFSRYLRITSPADMYKLPAAVAFTAIAPLPSIGGITNPDTAGFSIQSIANLGLILALPFAMLGFFLFKGEKILLTDVLLIKWIPLLMLCALSILYMGNLRYKATLLVYFACWATLAFAERKKLKGKLLTIYGLSFLAIVLILPIAILFR